MKFKSKLLLPLVIVLIIVLVLVNKTTEAPEIESSNSTTEDNLNNEKEKNNEEDTPQLEEISDEPLETEDDSEDSQDNIEEEDSQDHMETGDNREDNMEEMYVVKNVDDILVLVNKKRNLPADYIPSDLVKPDVNFSFKEDIPKRYLRKEAAEALEKLFEEAKQDNIILYAVSGYRSYNRQKTLFDNKSNQVGPEAANLVVAYPGQSEHQTGLAMDVSSQSANFALEEYFEDTPEGKWLKDNAHRAGFIIRFKKDATDITGYSYEPWHIRYVGEDVAKEIYERDIVLEEYFGDTSDGD